MKKLSVALLVCSALLLSACSNEKKSTTTASTSDKQETVNSSSKEKAKKEASEKKKAEEAEKKKQEEISKKVTEADTAMKAAEANPTDETLATAKKAIDAIPGGNNELQKRLEAVTGKLNEIKQQVAVQQEQQQSVQDQPQMTNPDSDFIDADGNGFDDRSPMNDDTMRAQAAAEESAAQARYWEAYNNGANPDDALAYADGRSDSYTNQQNDAVAQLDQYRADYKAQNGREPTSGEIQSQWLKDQGIE